MAGFLGEQRSGYDRIARADAGRLAGILDRAYAAVFAVGTPAHRAGYARIVAQVNGAPALADDYAAQAGDAATAPEVEGFVDLVARAPAFVSRDALENVTRRLGGEDQVLELLQTVALVSFQVRLRHAVAMLSGTAPVVDPRTAPPARDVSRAVTFERSTLDAVTWTPRLAPIDEADLTERHRAAFAGKGATPFFRVLARWPELLEHRTQIDHWVFRDAPAETKGLLEFAALVSSRVGGCRYCASVHARKAAHHLRDRTLAEQAARYLVVRDRDGQPFSFDLPTAVAAAGHPPRFAAAARVSADLAFTPSRLAKAGVDAAREHFSELELLRILAAAAFFSWANRLMLVLGGDD